MGDIPGLRPELVGRRFALIEFTLARIAEDEEPTYSLTPYTCEPGCCAPAGWVGAQCRYCDAAPIYGGTVESMTRSAEEHAETIHQRSRVLAECEAKRRIVDRWQDIEVLMLAGKGGPTAIPLALERAAVCRELAAVWSDHPDYDKDWKP